MRREESRWTIAELGDEVARALDASGYQPPPNGQVRAIPDLRTIRYYTTLGLVDRPLELRGRTALYGRRHLLQLCAVKRLQADGLTLDAVQAELTGAGDRTLARIARVEVPAAGAATRSEPVRREARFWEREPAAASAEPEFEQATGDRRQATGDWRRGQVEQFVKVKVGEGVWVVVETGGAGDAFEGFAAAEGALRRSAAPLVEELRRRGLLPEERE